MHRNNALAIATVAFVTFCIFGSWQQNWFSRLGKLKCHRFRERPKCKHRQLPAPPDHKWCRTPPPIQSTPPAAHYCTHKHMFRSTSWPHATHQYYGKFVGTHSEFMPLRPPTDRSPLTSTS